jgi:hypothetical protein
MYQLQQAIRHARRPEQASTDKDRDAVIVVDNNEATLPRSQSPQACYTPMGQ